MRHASVTQRQHINIVYGLRRIWQTQQRPIIGMALPRVTRRVECRHDKRMFTRGCDSKTRDLTRPARMNVSSMWHGWLRAAPSVLEVEIRGKFSVCHRHFSDFFLDSGRPSHEFVIAGRHVRHHVLTFLVGARDEARWQD